MPSACAVLRRHAELVGLKSNFTILDPAEPLPVLGGRCLVRGESAGILARYLVGREARGPSSAG